MLCHRPGCGGSPHDIEHRYFTWSGGARACDRGCLAAVPIPDNQREYDIQHGLVDIVAHTMTIACGRLKREDFSSVYFDAHQRVLVLDPWTELKGPPTRVPAPKAAEYGS